MSLLRRLLVAAFGAALLSLTAGSGGSLADFATGTGLRRGAGVFVSLETTRFSELTSFLNIFFASTLQANSCSVYLAPILQVTKIADGALCEFCEAGHITLQRLRLQAAADDLPAARHA